MIREDIEKSYITNSDGIFSPLYTFKEIKKEIDGEIIKDFDYTIIKTADEMYQEYLDNKNNPPKKEPTETEILQKQLLETQNMLLELQYKLTNKDLTNNLK